MRHYGHRLQSMNLASMARHARPHKQYPKLDSPAAVATHLSFALTLASQQPDMGGIHLGTVAEEMAWLLSEQQVFFIESTDLALALIHGADNIPDPTPILNTPQRFMLMAPEGLTINGEQCRGMIVSCGYDGTDAVKTLSTAIQQPITMDENHHDAACIHIAYQAKSSGQEYCYFAASRQMVADILAMKNPEEYLAYQGTADGDTTRFLRPPSDKDALEQMTVVKLVCGFLVYKHALPDRVTAGLPGAVNRQEFTHPAYKKPHTLIVKNPVLEASGTTKTGHYRSWHFRQLNDARYYQGEHKDKERGSRIVFVADSYIHRDNHDIATART